MVSASNLLTLGVIFGGVALFFGLGGAQGIGSKLGGGFASLGSSFLTGLGIQSASGQTPASTNNTITPPTSLTGQPPAIGLAQLNANLVATQGTLQGINNFISNLFSGSLFNPGAFSTASSFTPGAIQTRIGQAVGGANQPISAGGTPFGGFTNAQDQEIALQEAIVQSKLDNPSFFK